MYADLVFTGGPVFRPDGPLGGPDIVDVAVRAGRIVAVGQVNDLIGSRTEIVPIEGMLIPGVQDAHVHPVWGGLEAMRCDLTAFSTAPEYRQAIAEYARTHPGREWITGGGWSMAAFAGGTPTSRDLNGIVTDRPVLLHNCDHHGAWVNDRALELAGIDRYTPDPPDGRIEHDAQGDPTGMLHEGAVDLVARHLPAITNLEYESALRLAQAHLHRLGITGWQDAILGDYNGYRDPSPAYRALAASGELTARVSGALWWERQCGVDQIDSLIERCGENAIGRFGTRMVKIMLDGVAENFTAALTDPYVGGHGRGLSFVDFEALPGYVKALAQSGFGVHFHAIGDAAVRAALDAVAHSGSGPQLRHQIAHLQLVRPDDVARFARLGVIANMQPFWACHEPQLDTLAIPVLGPERSGWLYPFADLLRHGTTLAGGSDWPVSSANPWHGIHVAVHRAFDGGVLLPEQRLDLTSALTAYTAGSCHANGCDEAGAIAVGRLADLVLLDRDPYRGEIAQTRVLQTFVGGERVYAGD